MWEIVGTFKYLGVYFVVEVIEAMQDKSLTVGSILLEGRLLK